MKINNQHLYKNEWHKKTNGQYTEKRELGQGKTFAKTIKHTYGSYNNYNGQGEFRESVETRKLSITEEQLQEMLQNKELAIETDGTDYWLFIEGVRYDLKIIPKDEEEHKSNAEILLNTVEECLERAQKRLDKKFYDWTMKKDILYPNVGKNAMITLEDIIEKQQKKKEEFIREGIT